MPGEGIPAIKWGTFKDDHGISHIAPALEGYLMRGHVLTLKCPCFPRVEKGKNVIMIVHYVIH